MSTSTRSRGLRRRRPNYDDSSSSWLVTYSDAITLLLAFFVMILSVSDLNEGKVEALKESMAGLLGEKNPVTPFTDIKDGLEELIEKNNLQQEVSVTLDKKGVKVEFANVALYESGSANIKPESLALLDEVTQVIKNTSHETHLLEVEGHTDDVPIHTEQFPSNWELSAARASNIVKFLAAQGVQKKRLKASGYADSQPKEGSESLPLEEQRAANRRVVVFVRRY